MANFTAGTFFTDGVTNDVTALKLNALVADAVPTSNLSLNSTTGTIATFNSTTGTIATLNSTTGTIATLNSTTGTIATLNSTTGTIATLNSTTPTFLGAITASTNTINVGSGQIFKDASGNVGVGTASPSQKLDVSGGVAARGVLFLGDGSSSVIRKLNASTPLTIANSGGAAEMTIDSSGNVGIGTSPINKLHLYNGTGSVGATQLELEGLYNGYGAGINFSSRTSSGGTLVSMAKITADAEAAFNTTPSTQDSRLVFSTTLDGTLTERLRIDSSGSVIIGKSSNLSSVAGVLLDKIANEFTVASTVMSLNRLTSDGTLIGFSQDNTLEGTISVAGTTVSYNGGHLSRWSQLLSGQRDASIKKGTVMSNLNEMCEWFDKDGKLLPNEQLNKVKVSDVEGEGNVAGVFVNWDNDDKDNPFDMNMAMTGDMIIRIAQGTIVNRGDLLISAGDGTAKPQGDDIIRSKTIAKVTSTNVTCTYEDGSYCIPCVLMAC